MVVLEDRTLLATMIVVNNPTDTPVAGQTDLRQAIEQANSNGGDQTIVFDRTVFKTPQTITLNGTPLELNDTSGTETITGPAAGVTVSGGGSSRVFQVDTLVTASISGLTITGGSVSGSNGGGLANSGTVTLTNCTVSGNSASAVFVSGPIGGDGGGLYNDGTATLTLSDCTVSGNSASDSFGAPSHGGGLSDMGAATLTNCTVTGNSATDGGGLYISKTVTLTDCTVTGNTATPGNGGGLGGIGMATLTNTIVARQKTGVDISCTASGNYNLIGDGSEINGSTGNLLGTPTNPIDPLLGELGDYGGPTPTMALRPGSPAIGKGTAAGGVATDQRGFPLDSPTPDIGAFQTNPLVVNTIIDGTGSPSGHLSLRQAVNLANVLGAAETITFDPTVFATPQTITLTGTQLELSNTSGTETITGPAAGVTVSGNNASRVFNIAANVTASFSGMTITRGSANNPGISISGGGIINLGNLTVVGCTVSGNSALQGGGLWSSGTAILTNCTVSGNFAASTAGGLFNYGTATLTNCTVSGNSSPDSGGLRSTGTATLTDCTVSGNSATSTDGGGLENEGTATLADCTVSGNSAASAGGGLFSFGAATLTTLTNCTVSGNFAADTGGGLFNIGVATLTNCTVSGNSSPGGGGLVGSSRVDLQACKLEYSIVSPK